MNCVLCEDKNRILENELAFAVLDINPVSKGHTLFITKRHVKDFFETTLEERIALFELVDIRKRELDIEYNPSGYNIGINCGVAAGQTIMHLHIHLISRYENDVESPRGGVRGVIPNKKEY